MDDYVDKESSNIFLFPIIFIPQLQQSGNDGTDSTDSAATCQKLKGDLQAVFNVLPKDVQQLLLLNPQRAALLKGTPEDPKLPGRLPIQVGVVSPTSPR